MAYYIITFASEALSEFQKRMPFLKDAVWIKDTIELAQTLASSTDEEGYFFVHLTNHDVLMDEIVVAIREFAPSAKILYIVEDEKAHDLKAHQLTSVGGDAYVKDTIDPTNLALMLEALKPVFNQHGNRLEANVAGSFRISANEGLDEFKNHPKSLALDKIFMEAVGEVHKKPSWQTEASLTQSEHLEELIERPPEIEELEFGDDMSDKDKELSLDDLGDLELGEEESESLNLDSADDGMALDLGELDLSLSDSNEVQVSTQDDEGMDFSLGEDFDLDSSSVNKSSELSIDEALSFELEADGDDLDLSLSEESLDDLDLDLGGEESDIDLSDDALKKLKEIDAIMDNDASKVDISLDFNSAEDALLDLGHAEPEAENLTIDADSDIDTSLVSDDLNLDSLNFAADEEEVAVVSPVATPKKRAVREAPDTRESYDGDIGRDLKEISGAYSGEMERMQATLSNLRSDREELLSRIQKLEEDKVIQQRSSLTMRAELDEKKIELSIIRKKNNEEIAELKDRLKLFEEKKLILEERNRILSIELDKAGQKNKIDVKKVQMRERELEQKLELLKADSETQIRHRDLKILELKRKLDAMEFDIESISVQEKRSVESRFELEDKLDKAIKTLRNAITVLEDESEKSSALEALKKNIDM